MGLFEVVNTIRLHRHDLKSDTQTLCGIDVDTKEGQTLEVGCDCRHPLCKYPITCPVCLSLQKGIIN